MTNPSGDGEAPATNVVEAWLRVLRDMPAIGKDKKMTQGEGYMYRSIEQFTAHAALLFAKHGVIVMPMGEEIEYIHVGDTRNGAAIWEARGKWSWLIYGPGGPSDVIHAASFGQGRDTSDKAAQKAATSAFKYLLMPALMISDSKDDPDHDRIETGTAPPAEPRPAPVAAADPERAGMIFNLCTDLRNLDNEGTGPYIKALKAEAGDTVPKLKAWIEADYDHAEETVKRLTRELKEERDRINGVAQVEEEKPKRAPRSKTRAGSAVTPETQEAIDRATKAFPGTTVEGEPNG